MKVIFSATEARANFFNILNRVLFGGETIFVRKSGVDSVVKLEVVSDSRKLLADLAGSIAGEDAKVMEKTVGTVKKYPKRETVPFG